MAQHFILDGYNIIKCSKHLADLSLQNGREGLLNLIDKQRPQGSKNNPVTVVFDGKPDVFGGQGHPTIQVIFTRNETADDWIKNCVARARHKKSLVIVSNDREICYYVRSLGAKTMASAEFISRLSQPTSTVQKSPERKSISRIMEQEINKELRSKWLKEKNN